MQCSICEAPLGESIHDRHNAQPINDGTCCTDCNDNVVTPRRLKDMGYTVVPFPFKSEGRIA
jgi:hypothetical protein